MMNLVKEKKFLSLIFFAAFFFIIFFEPYPSVKPINVKLLKNLLNTGDKGFKIPGQEYEVFKAHLPKAGAVSFIMDYPFSNYGRTVEQIYTAQSYLAPIVLNTQPVEDKAIVFCSSEPIAERRLELTGYEWEIRLGQGKGIARRSA